MRNLLNKYLTGASMIALTFSLNTSAANAACSPMPTCESMGYNRTSCPSGVESLKCPFDTTKIKCIQDCADYPLSSCNSNFGTCVQCGSKWKYIKCNNPRELDSGGYCSCPSDYKYTTCPEHAYCLPDTCNGKYAFDMCEWGYYLNSHGTCGYDYQIGDIVYNNSHAPIGVVFFADSSSVKAVALNDINLEGNAVNSATLVNWGTTPCAMLCPNSNWCYYEDISLLYSSLAEGLSDYAGIMKNECAISCPVCDWDDEDAGTHSCGCGQVPPEGLYAHQAALGYTTCSKGSGLGCPQCAGCSDSFYIPSLGELKQIYAAWHNGGPLAQSLSAISGATQFQSGKYWSSTEIGSSSDWSAVKVGVIDFSDGTPGKGCYDWSVSSSNCDKAYLRPVIVVEGKQW